MKHKEEFRRRLKPGARETNLDGAFAVDGPVDPALRARFAQLELRPGQRIVPVLSVDRYAPPRRPLGKRRTVQSTQRVRETSPGWAGAIQSGTWRSVTGTWKVPAITKGIDDPPGGDGRYWVYSWVGLDGWGENEVLQIGVAQRVDADGSTNTWGWYEWLAEVTPESPPYVSFTSIENLTVNPGDHVCASVEYLIDDRGSPYAGNIALANITTGEHFGICLQPPPKVSMPGSMCEWIVENPGGGYPAFSLALFTPTAFTDTACTSFDGATTARIGDSQELVDIVRADGTVMTFIRCHPSSDLMDAAYYKYNL